MTNNKYQINSKFQIPNSNQGFTLIELLTVMVMVVLIAGISIANFRKGEKQKTVNLASDIVINSVRNAQNFSLSGKNTTNVDPTCRVPQYYYITFVYTSSYSLFARNNCGTDDQIESYNLPQNTRIKTNGLIFNGLTATSSLTVIFYPPFATIKGNRDGNSNTTFATETITVESNDSAVSKIVTIDGVAGRIGE